MRQVEVIVQFDSKFLESPLLVPLTLKVFLRDLSLGVFILGNVLAIVIKSAAMDINRVLLFIVLLLVGHLLLLSLCSNLCIVNLIWPHSFSIRLLFLFLFVASNLSLRAFTDLRYLISWTHELEFEVFEARLHQGMLMVLLFRAIECFLKSRVLWVFSHLLIVRTMLTMVCKPATVGNIPRELLILLLSFEGSLLGSSTHRDSLEIDHERIWVCLERTRP